MKYKENVHFRFVDFNDSDITGVELLLDNYKGVVYHYGKARVVEDEGIARLQFGYTLVYPGELDIDELNSDEDFFNIMGEILTYILTEQAKDEARNNNSEKLNFQ